MQCLLSTERTEQLGGTAARVFPVWDRLGDPASVCSFLPESVLQHPCGTYNKGKQEGILKSHHYSRKSPSAATFPWGDLGEKGAEGGRNDVSLVKDSLPLKKI